MSQLALTLIPYLVPAVIIVLGYFAHVMFVYLPSQQQQYVIQVVNMAVMMLKEQFASKTQEQQAQLVLAAVKAFFDALNLACPSDAILQAFIIAAIQALEAK